MEAVSVAGGHHDGDVLKIRPSVEEAVQIHLMRRTTRKFFIARAVNAL